MEKVERSLTGSEIIRLRRKYGDYAKIVVDIEREVLVLGCLLHIDGAKLLLSGGSKNKNLWGGGIDWLTRRIDANAVFNIRPNIGNDSMEILDPKTRSKFMAIATLLLLKNA